MSNETAEQFLPTCDDPYPGFEGACWVVTEMIGWIQGENWHDFEDLGQITQWIGEAFVLGVRAALADPARWAAFCEASDASDECDRLEPEGIGASKESWPFRPGDMES